MKARRHVDASQYSDICEPRPAAIQEVQHGCCDRFCCYSCVRGGACVHESALSHVHQCKAGREDVRARGGCTGALPTACWPSRLHSDEAFKLKSTQMRSRMSLYA